LAGRLLALEPATAMNRGAGRCPRIADARLSPHGRAVAYGSKVLFAAVGKSPRMVVAADVLAFVTVQYAGGSARRLQVAGEAGGVSARTVRRRSSSVSGLFAFLRPTASAGIGVQSGPAPVHM
jgi:hypothetical protein